VMLEGTGLVALLPEVALLAVWGTVSFALALKLFRWQ
jgi:ABC-2 type transport system permease protein